MLYTAFIGLATRLWRSSSLSGEAGGSAGELPTDWSKRSSSIGAPCEGVMRDRHMRDRLRWGMVGGGLGSQIGEAHRVAARMDGLFEFCAGAIDVDPAK